MVDGGRRQGLTSRSSDAPRRAALPRRAREADRYPILLLQRTEGNQAVQRLLRDGTLAGVARAGGPGLSNQLIGHYLAVRAVGRDPGPAGRRAAPERARAATVGARSTPVQRALGLEIEVPIPIVHEPGRLVLTAGPLAGPPALPYHQQLVVSQQYDNVNSPLAPAGGGKVSYGRVVKPAAGGFHVEADKDDRVRGARPPIREGGNDAIMEIVTAPADTTAQFRATMQQVRLFVQQVQANTAGLTNTWIDPYGTGVSIGPVLMPGAAAARQAEHNWQGSVQVNVGIDLRQYHSLMKWFAGSKYAKSRRANDPAAQIAFRAGKQAMRTAVDWGRDLTGQLAGGTLPGQLTFLGPGQLAASGRLRGLRGWLTHISLYLLRGALLAAPGGSEKNLAPVLMKSTPQVASTYGMTAIEQNLFNNNSLPIVNEVLARSGRVAPLAAPALAATQIFLAPAPVGGGAIPGTIADLTNLGGGAAAVPLAGTPLQNPTGVGTTGRLGLPAVPLGPGIVGAGQARGGVVAEYRTLPGYHDGPDRWEQLGLEFMRQAIKRNRR